MSRWLARIGSILASAVAIYTLNPLAMMSGFMFIGMAAHYEHLLNRDNGKKSDKE